MNMDSQSASNALPRVVLYTRDGCHLCEVVHKMLLQHGVEPQCIDIDADLELKNCFHDCVPVVEIDGKIRFRGRVEPLLLQRFLRR